MATRFLCRMLSRSLTIKQQPFIGITCPLSRGMSTTYTTFSYKISPALYNVEIGCDLKHWRILVRKSGALFNKKSRDEVINFYVKTLAAGIGDIQNLDPATLELLHTSWRSTNQSNQSPVEEENMRVWRYEICGHSRWSPAEQVPDYLTTALNLGLKIISDLEDKGYQLGYIPGAFCDGRQFVEDMVQIVGARGRLYVFRDRSTGISFGGAVGIIFQLVGDTWTPCDYPRWRDTPYGYFYMLQ